MRSSFLAALIGIALVCVNVPAVTAATAHPLDKLISREEKEVVPFQYRKRIVKYKSDEAKGTIIVETKKRFLYLIVGNGKAERYGVGVGREGFLWSGTAYIKKKAMWPKWTPASEAIERSPYLEPYKNGMPGGRDNPLGARAMYLFNEGGDTLYRIHGTTNPWSIGKGGTAGCLRMLNQEIVQLYERVPIGTKVIVK